MTIVISFLKKNNVLHYINNSEEHGNCITGKTYASLAAAKP